MSVGGTRIQRGSGSLGVGFIDSYNQPNRSPGSNSRPLKG